MNAILEKITENRNGFYVHAIEVNDVYELQNAIECIYNEFESTYDREMTIDFFNSMEIYCLDDSNSEEVHNFNITDYINNL